MYVKRPLAAAAVLMLTVAALAGSALAAPPESPPGQEKKAEEAQAPEAPPGQEMKAEQAATGSSTPPGQAKQSSATTTTQSQGINSTASGVKPSNDTEKHTMCETGGSMPTPSCTGANVSASATSDHSKRYGNGGTAAQIAVSRGAPAGTDIRGPGNSQPHKVCKKVNANGKTVWVDVHAVKSYAGVCVAAAALPSVQQQSGARVTEVPEVSGAAVSAAAVSTTPAAGGVAGVTGAPSGGKGGEEVGGVAGAFAEIGGVAGAALPFTGLSLWAIVLIALASIAVGYGLWRGRPVRDVA